LRGLFWESNSIPEQVPQAGLVARGILQRVAARDTRGAASAAAEPVELLGG